MTFALFAAALTLLAQAPAPAPAPNPVLLDLKPDAQGRLLVAVTEAVPVTEAYTYTEADGGSQVTKTGTRTRIVTVTKTIDLATTKALTVTTAGGEPVESADALKALRAGAVVVASPDGNPVAAKYLKLFKADVLVLGGKGLAFAPPAAPPQGR